jgi:hypothetical protein
MWIIRKTLKKVENVERVEKVERLKGKIKHRAQGTEHGAKLINF